MAHKCLGALCTSNYYDVASVGVDYLMARDALQVWPTVMELLHAATEVSPQVLLTAVPWIATL